MKTKQKPKTALATVPKAEPKAIPAYLPKVGLMPGSPEFLERQERMSKAQARGEVLKAVSAEFKHLDDLEMAAVLGLVELLSERDGSECSPRASWLAGFMYYTLREIPFAGLARAENNPTAALSDLRKRIEEFQSDLEGARDLASLYEDYNALAEEAKDTRAA